jgi:hypothetical protein
MKTRTNKSYFPFNVSEPQHMLPLEQVFCLVWLAQNYSLAELRKKQDIIEQQIQSAHKRSLLADNLLAMQDNVAAAVAYQAFPDDDLWASFIRQTG